MDDKLQDAINALHAAGPVAEADADAVEELRERYNRKLDAYHAGQRASYADGLRDGREPKEDQAMTDAKVNIERKLELIDGMIEVQLHHAEQCDRIANRTMAEKQKGWDMERVALLRKMRAALEAQPAEPCMDTVLRNAARRSATIVDRGRMVDPVEPVAWPEQADPFTYIIQHLNSSTYNMTKAECIHFIGKLRDHYAAPPAPAALTDEWAAVVLGIAHDTLPVSEFSAYQRERIACVLAGARAVLAAASPPAPAAVPPGYALVPIEPTPEMWDAAWESIGLPYRAKLSIHEIRTFFAQFHAAMIAAAGDRP